jgi:hypothetical protein
MNNWISPNEPPPIPEYMKEFNWVNSEVVELKINSHYEQGSYNYDKKVWEAGYPTRVVQPRGWRYNN